MKIKLDNGIKMPTRVHKDDAGIDIYCPFDFTVEAKDSYVVDTGVHIAIPVGYVGMIKSKSGLNVNHNITTEGVIDCGYTGSIKLKLYNNGFTDYHFCEGDKLTQLVILPYFTEELELVDELEATERGDNGFGSSGK